MHDVEAADRRGERAAHRRRPIEPTQPAAREVGDLDTLQVDRPLQRHVAVGRAIDAGREDMDVMAVGRERPAKRVD
jgi:hypothetical protein